MSVSMKVRALDVALVCIGALSASSAWGQVFNAAHHVYISGPPSEIDSGILSSNASAQQQYSFNDPVFGLIEFTADAMTSGGQRPLADVQASVVNGFVLHRSAIAELTYGYRVTAVAGSTRTSVPLVINAKGDVFATASSSLVDVSGVAIARVFKPGDNNNPVINELASAQITPAINNPGGSFNRTISTVVTAGLTGRVELRSSILLRAEGEVSATSDPTFLIDPDATYEEDGVVYRYADEFMIEYSLGIEQYIPCGPDINEDGQLDFFDVSGFLSAMTDYNGDSQFDFFDVSAFLSDFGTGCP